MSTQAVSSTSQASNRPPVTVGNNTHLDPGAYARGTHAVALGDNILIHPRAQLIAIHGPLSIGDGCIISEKCIIGGPVPTPADTTTKTAGSNPPTPLLDQGGDDDEHDPVKTTIGQNVYIHASSHVHAGATVRDGVLIESHVTVPANITIGAHAKICAGVIVEGDVVAWEVVYGNGDLKRKRKKPGDVEVSVDLDALQSGDGLSKERLQNLYETQRQQQNQPQWGFQEDLSDMIAQESRKRLRKEEERRGKH